MLTMNLKSNCKDFGTGSAEESSMLRGDNAGMTFAKQGGLAFPPARTFAFLVCLTRWQPRATPHLRTGPTSASHSFVAPPEHQPLPDLNPADRHDLIVARHFASTLPGGHTICLRDEQATRSAIDAEFARLCGKSTNEDDVIIVFFSGHVSLPLTSSSANTPISILSLSCTTSEWQIPPSWTFSETFLECVKGSSWVDKKGKGVIDVEDLWTELEEDVLFADGHIASHHVTPDFNAGMHFARPGPPPCTSQPKITPTVTESTPDESLDAKQSEKEWKVGDRVEVWIPEEAEGDNDDGDDDDEEEEEEPTTRLAGMRAGPKEDGGGDWCKAKIIGVVPTTPASYVVRFFHYTPDLMYPRHHFTAQDIRPAEDPLYHLRSPVISSPTEPSTDMSVPDPLIGTLVVVLRGASRQKGTVEEVKGGCVFVVYEGTRRDVGEWVAGGDVERDSGGRVVGKRKGEDVVGREKKQKRVE
ncbi:hypothetical protein M427DRAFT_427278 [Gonapodya prolifera JEL478]|uniref:Uncharacterized protein n=1 Tax=Gonapodya prolifera (strain JEL478) TaxID=1344416 RepID=A0A139ASE9_GONPJ|nr:hypothetical protein M427DRAFT_427278 [Gonapodya prolifera JEL478]|eukprot:KXS19670.1 hypothetical protein M427DRAFT_427278 [Gonapodya prolifera JEL478]